jgi:hypothetical protein
MSAACIAPLLNEDPMAPKNLQFTMSCRLDSNVGRFLSQFPGKTRAAMIIMITDEYLQRQQGGAVVIPPPKPVAPKPPQAIPVVALEPAPGGALTKQVTEESPPVRTLASSAGERDWTACLSEFED